MCVSIDHPIFVLFSFDAVSNIDMVAAQTSDMGMTIRHCTDCIFYMMIEFLIK
jgi:hypothetical protein